MLNINVQSIRYLLNTLVLQQTKSKEPIFSCPPIFHNIIKVKFKAIIPRLQLISPTLL